MTITTAVEDGRIGDAFAAVYRRLCNESERTETEREAFAAFAERVRQVQPAAPAGGTGPQPAAAGGATAAINPQVQSPSRGTPALAAVREAYEETVMSVPFYDAEYGDTYAESVRAEFGPEVGTALTRADRLTPAAKRALLANVEQAKQEREALLENCRRERESVEAAEAALAPVAEELRSLEETRYDHQAFGALETYWERLRALEGDCEDAAAARQEAIERMRRRHRLSVDAPDLAAYLYRDFEPTYPVLFLCSDLARTAESCRVRVERAMCGE